MTTIKLRNYNLSGGYEDAIALDDDHIEDRVEETWWHPYIPRKELKALMARSDAPALMNFGLWIALLLGSGYLAFLSWGTWWAIPAFLIYGTIYSSSDARWHECGHGTPFKTRWINEVFYHLSSFMTLREAFLWRWSHARHHTHTIVVGLDPEISVKRPADLVRIVLDFFYINAGPIECWRIVRHAFGRPDSDVRNFMPESERWKMYWSSRVYVAIIVAVAIYSVSIGSFLPMMFVALPRFYGGWLHNLLGLTQHAGLEENIYDHRQNTRTVFINPVFRFLYLNMNYHIEHHSIPMIPFFALPKLHEAIKDQTPTPYPNLWAVYKEMIPTLYKQATQDPDYHIVRKMPESSPEVTAETINNGHHTVIDASSTTRWFEVCPVADLDENDVTSFKHDGRISAIYRLSEDNFYASDGLCTHGKTELGGGLVINGCIECPKHNGRFDVTTGKAVKAPAIKDLKTYPAQRRGNKVFINIPEQVEVSTLELTSADSELDRLKTLFDFTDEDLAANRSGKLSLRQENQHSQRMFKQPLDKWVSLFTYAMIVISLIIFDAFSLNFTAQLGPSTLVAIGIWLAIVFILGKLIRKVGSLIIRLNSDGKTKRTIDNLILKQATGRLQFSADGKHQYVMLDEFELTNSAATNSQKMLWQLKANMRYSVYYMEHPFWIVAVEPAYP